MVLVLRMIQVKYGLKRFDFILDDQHFKVYEVQSLGISVKGICYILQDELSTRKAGREPVT